MPLPPTRVTIPFHDDREYQYFCIFRDETAIELSGGFDPSLWNCLVVQACDNASIRELTTAVAALSVAGKHCTQARAPKSFCQQRDLRHDMSSHLQYALMQYDRALKRVQMMVSTGHDTMRVALITALLIFVFESLHGDTDRAVTPIQSALELILKRLSNLPRPYRASRTDPHRSQTSAPIDEELLSAFMRLDGPSLAITSKKDQIITYPIHRIFTITYHTEELNIPSCFATISEARLYLEDIKWRVVPGMDAQNAHTPARQDSPSHEYDVSSSENYEGTTGLLHPDLEFIRGAIRSWYPAVAKSSNSLDAKLTQLSQWHSAFAPLLEHSMTSAGANSFIPAVILYLQALTINLLLPDNTEQEMTSEGDRVQIVRTILSLSRRLANHPGFSRGFVFDKGIIPTLAIIIMLCPDRNLKWEACNVARSIVPRREGVWDSKNVVEGAERMLAQEDVKSWASYDNIDIGCQYDDMGIMLMEDEMIDLQFLNSDWESTSDQDSIDPRLLLHDMDSMTSDEETIDPRLRSMTLNIEPVALGDFLGH
jgi:hypothetical protein